MVTKAKSHKSKQNKARYIGKPTGAIQERIQIVGPEHFGVVAVVSAGGFAGEAGPIEHYATARAITGRAGIYPSRYQSDEVDRNDGAVARTCNRRLRAAAMLIAKNLIKCHPYYRGLAALMAAKKVIPLDRQCRIANRAMRMVFQIVGGRQVWRSVSGSNAG